VKKSGQKSDKKSGMTRYQKILIGIALGFLLYSILGFLVLPVLVKNILEKKLAENLKRQVSIENFQINPYSLKVTVNKFQVRNLAGDDNFIAFDRLFIDLEAMSLFKRALIVKSLVLSGPRANIARYKDLSFNFSDLAAGSEKKKKETSKPFLFSINNIEIRDGALTFLDEPKDTTHRVRDLNLSVPFLSNVAHYVETYVHPDFSAIVNDTPIKLSGQTIPFADNLRTVFNIKVSRLNIPAYLAYLPETGNLTVKSGFLDLTATLGFEMPPGGEPAVTVNGEFSIKQLSVASKDDENYLTIPQVDIKLADSKPLEKNFHFSSISLNEPKFLLRRNKAGDILPIDLLPKSTAQKTAETKSSERGSDLKLLVDDIALNSGRLQFEDQSNVEPFQTTINPIEIKVSNLSTQENAETLYEISMQTEAKENITIDGMMSLNPLGAKLRIAFQDMRIPRFKPYYSEFILPEIVDGSLDLSADISYTRAGKANKLNIDDMDAALTSIVINDIHNTKILGISSLRIKETSIDLNGKKIIVGDLASSDGDFHLVREKEGLVLLKELLKPKEDQKETNTSEPNSSSQWAITLKKSAISKYSVFLLDHTFAEPTTVTLDNIRLTAEDISNIGDQQGVIDIGLRVDKMGLVSIKGPVTITPLTATLTLDVSDLQVRNLQPYFEDKFTLANSDGNVSLSGQLKVSEDKNKKILTHFKGDGGITDFVSFDPHADEEFLKWKNLHISGIDYDSDRFAFKIKEIIWQDFYNKIIIFDDASVNLKAVVESPSGQAAETPSKAVETKKTPAETKNLLVEIDTVKLDNGEIEFLDRSIKPNYSSSFSEISGTITGLSSQADVMATVNISAKQDHLAPLQVTGKVNPLRDNLFADLTFSFRDIELSPTSPYTGKYIGYKIAKGKLSLDLNYLVEGTKIKGKNKAFLDQFTLGDTVKSPDAMNLPISLAIALLKNRKGEITLNVPVQGDLSDPEFSVGGVVFQAIVNLIAKAATSPFALLGALLPEGEDLQYVDFQPGSADITQEYSKNLEAVAKALYDRPGLKMDIKAGVNPDLEKPVLHEKQFEHLLKNEKLKALSKQKETIPPLEEITIAPDEFETFLEMAYKEADFEKPKNFIGLAKKLPQDEMEKLLRDHIVITDDDLRLLAIARANAVKSLLVEAGPVEPDRIFIVEPKVESGEGGSTRAEMIIK
jgi:Domain of Unknown Function (DUF748)